MGARAASIVVDDQDVAYRAIQVLRSQGRDRASFIPLSIIKKTPAKLTLPKEKGVIDFAIHLIDFDEAIERSSMYKDFEKHKKEWEKEQEKDNDWR